MCNAMATKTKVSFIALVVAVLFMLLGFIIINSRLYLPELPVDGLTKKQAYEKISNTENDIIYLINEFDRNWYIYQGNNQDLQIELIKRFKTLGIKFVEQLGSGYIFEFTGSEKKLIVESQMWTHKYVIFKMLDGVDLLHVKAG
jgi:hypothetical protein